jgi:hypothetical protein
MPETRRHFEQRTLLFEAIRAAFGDRATVGSDQFVFWDPTDPRQRCAPDLFVRLGEADRPFDSWKVWERGAPQVCVEIISASDAEEGPWESKLSRFERLGTFELVRFDPAARERLLRIWDRVDGSLVERDPDDAGFTRCDWLDAWWSTYTDAVLGRALRLARDPSGASVYKTPVEGEAEARQREAEARQREAEARQREAEARQREAEVRETCDARIRELEAELARTRGR